MFCTRYKIVRDEYNGYSAQFRYWWMPFYIQCFFSNTEVTVEKSKAIIDMHKNRVVYKENC